VACAGAFLALFWWQARRAGLPVGEWLRRRNAATFEQPRWWLPFVVWVATIVVLFITVTTAMHGWRWQYLLVIPLFGGFLALALPLLSWLARRR
jgi:hypothetical protein